MRVGGVFHPDFFYTPRRTTDTTQLADLEIFFTTPEADVWVPGVGVNPVPDVLAWTGKGRVQPNKDWRSRPREVQFEYDAVQAVRVQIPIGQNLAGATYDPNDPTRVIAFGPDPHFVKDMRVRIKGGPVNGFQLMEGDNLMIRNAVQSQNLWLYNLLCDIKTGGTDDR